MAKKAALLPYNSMTWDELAWKIDMEGFDYFFCDYASGPFQDKTLDELARKYREAAKSLKDYIDKQAWTPQ